ncbi:uncharacterized protein LOC144638124 isoform X2 [Oculina patagonica]
MRRWGGLKSCFSVECEGNGDMAVLDLRHCNLSSVPTDVFKAEPNLEEIYLDANQIRELPRALFGLQSLHILGLSDNELTVLPSAVSNLTNLREVDISKNGIIDLPESVKNCKCLEQFEASVNPIGKIPDGFTQLLNLTHVYLNDAFLDRLPSNFGRLSKLKVLELRENHLRSLPESMSYFTQLERLDIGNNEFVELPTVVGCLVNLKELWMDNNGVRELPPEIGLLRQLLFLDVSKNRLERLPPEIESLQSLTDLYLSNNLLLELLDNIGSLGNLQTLKVDENHLIELPASIGRLTNLEELVVNHNELESLPSSIGFLRKLRILYADENFLEAIPLELGSCSSMTILSLRDNRIVRIPDDIGRMPNLQVMNLACNRLECLPYTFRKLTSLKALWLSENQSKPMVPLQSDFDHGTQSHVLTCFMFPQQPPVDEVSSVSEQQSEDSAGSIPASLLEEQLRQRSSIVFNIDEDDYLSRLARYQSPYPKDVKDRATQYLASKRQQQQEIEVTQPVLPSQHQCHQQQRHQYRYQHKKQHSSPESTSAQNQQQASQQQPVAVVVQSVERSQQPQMLRPQELHTPTQTTEQRQAQPVVAVHPLNSNQRVISNGIAQRGNTGRVTANQNAEPQTSMRGAQATVRSIPGDRLIGGQAATQEEPPSRTPPVYQPPPPYTPRGNRIASPPPPEGDRRTSVETQHSFREEVPSSVSSYHGRPGARLWSSSTGTPETGQLGEMHSFNEQEPSFLQGPLRPPSYYEATNQSDRVPIGTAAPRVIHASQGVPNAGLTNGTNIGQRSPPPQYSVQPEVFAELPVRQVLPEPEVPSSTGTQSAAQVMNSSQRLDISQEVAQRFENRVREIQQERALERGEVTVNGPRANVGDNRRPQEIAPSIPRVLHRSNSSESRNSEQSVQSSQEDEEPVDNDPNIELLHVEVYKNPNLGFSVGGGVGSSSNPFHPNDNKSIYVTKVQPDGPASFGLIPGDRILEVNGINLRRVTHEKAVLFLKHNQVVNLLIARNKEQPS